MTLVDRIATEVAADEAELRGRIVGLIDDGKIEEAKAILRDWNVMAARDVLTRYAKAGDGCQS